MNNNFKKFNIWKGVIVFFFILMTQLFCYALDENTEVIDIYSDIPFAPPVLIPLESDSAQLARTAPAIKLDSKKVAHPEFDINFLSPSEYKTKLYKNVDNQLVPVEEPNTIQEADSNQPNIDEPEKAEYVNKDFLPISNTSNTKLQHDENSNIFPYAKSVDLPSPSEYKIKLKKDIAPSEIPELEPESPQQASVTADNIPDDVVEGREISSIIITGNNKVSSDLILNAIKLKEGDIFNTELLQLDLQRIYMLGYFTENMAIEPIIKNDGKVEIVFELEENVIIKDIKINGNTVYSNAELKSVLQPLINMPQNINKINEYTKKINEYYSNDGYILAHVDSIDDNKDGELIIHISEGIIEKFELNEDRKTKDFVIWRNILTKPGSVYNEEILKQDITRLYATQIFEDVERIIEPSPDKEGEYIVTIKVKEASSNNVAIGAGIDSALGLFGQVSINEKNFLGRGQFLGLSGMIGSGILLSDASIKNRMNYNIELNFKEPYFLNADNSLSAKAYYRDLGSYQIPLAIERRFGFNSAITHKLFGSEKVKATLGAGYEHIHLSEGDYNKISSVYESANMSISERAKQLTGGSFFNIAPGISYSTLDDDFMPRSGMIAKASYTESIGLSHIKNTNGRIAGNITRYIPVFKKSTIALTARGGVRVHGDMPEVMAFSLGGPYSIRGFRMNGVGTGSAFLMGSAELQTPIPFFDRFKYNVLKNMRLAFFVDTGKIFDPTITSKLYDRPLSAVTAGIGLRINIPGVGPLTIDYALPFTHTGKYNPNGGFFSFGTSGLYDSY